MDKSNGAIKKSKPLLLTIEFWIIFLVLLDAGSVYYLAYSVVLDLTIGIICISRLAIRGGGISRRVMPLLFFLVSWFVLGSLVTGTPLPKYFGIIYKLILIVLIFGVFRNRMEEISHYLYFSLWVLAIHGIFNFIAYTLFTPLFTATTFGEYSTDTLGYIFFYETATKVNDIYILRNKGVFWEPGLYQIFLNILLYYILILKRMKIIQSIVPVLLIISTISTTGYITMLVIILYKLFVIDKIRLSFKQIIMVVFVAMIIAPVVILAVVSKFTGEDAGSAGVRIYDILFGWEVIKSNPFLGAGFGSDAYDNISRNISVSDFYDETFDYSMHEGNTNTFMGTFMTFGIPVGILSMYGLINQQLIKDVKRCFFIVLFLSLSSEPLGTTILYWLFIFSSFFKTKMKQKSISQI